LCAVTKRERQTTGEEKERSVSLSNSIGIGGAQGRKEPKRGGKK